MPISTVTKCWGIVVCDEDETPQPVREFVEELIERAGVKDLGGLKRLSLCTSTYHGYSRLQPCVFGVKLKSEDVSMRRIAQMMSGSWATVERHERKEIEAWEAQIEPYRDLIEKHGIKFDVCWLVGTD